jgi:hypothetical protein
MNNTTKQNETKVIEKSQTVRELHESELEQISGAAMGDCWHWKNSSKSWGF